MWYGIALQGVREWRANLEFLIKLGMTLQLEKDEEEKQEQENTEEKLRRLSKAELELFVKLHQKMEGKKGPHGSEIKILPKEEVIDIEPVEEKEPIQYRRRDRRKVVPALIPRKRARAEVPMLEDAEPVEVEYDDEPRDSEGYTEAERMQVRPMREIAC